MGSGKLLGVVLQQVHFVIIEIRRIMADGGDEQRIIDRCTAAVFYNVKGYDTAGNIIVVCLLMDEISERVYADLAA